MTEIHLGEKIGKLGYGNMRLPKINGEIDMKTVNEMIDAFLDNGFTYFDTAYIYEGSEEVLNKALVSRHPRDRFQIATKISMMKIKDAAEMQHQVDTSLARLGTDFIDFYLIHGLNEAYIKKADEVDAWSFIRGLKEKGIAKHIGFSFHGTPEELEYLLETHPYFEFVQLQINYLDWENPGVQSKRMYEIARAHGKPISVMEPNKGGWLAGESSEVANLLREAQPDASTASWAFRFLLGLEGLMTILTGVGTIEEMMDNVKTFKENKPLSDEEHVLIKKAVDIIESQPTIPCTGCAYCVPNCPKKIIIPAYMRIYSNYLVYRNLDTLKHIDFMLSIEGGQASDCVACGACEKACPQHLEIAKYMAEVTALVGPSEEH